MDSEVAKNLSSETTENGKAHDFVIRPPENVVSVIFLFEIETVTTKLVYSKSLKKSVVSFIRCGPSLRKTYDWFCCMKISQKLKYLNSKCEQNKRYFCPILKMVSPICACPMRTNSCGRRAKGVKSGSRQ